MALTPELYTLRYAAAGSAQSVPKLVGHGGKWSVKGRSENEGKERAKGVSGGQGTETETEFRKGPGQTMYK